MPSTSDVLLSRTFSSLIFHHFSLDFLRRPKRLPSPLIPSDSLKERRGVEAPLVARLVVLPGAESVERNDVREGDERPPNEGTLLIAERAAVRKEELSRDTLLARFEKPSAAGGAGGSRVEVMVAERERVPGGLSTEARLAGGIEGELIEAEESVAGVPLPGDDNGLSSDCLITSIFGVLALLYTVF